MKKILLILSALVIIAANIGCDQASKQYARKHFKNKPAVHFAMDTLVIVYAENSGGFLSLGSNIKQPFKMIVMIIIPVIAVLFALIFIFTGQYLSWLELFLICGVLGGGISNLYDRIIHNGMVTDFLNVGIGNIRTGIFNLADMAIMFGLLFLVIIQLMKKPKIIPA
jgi:signal peptidase II